MRGLNYALARHYAKRRKEREEAQAREQDEQRRIENDRQRRKRLDVQKRQVADIILQRQLDERAKKKEAQEEEFRKRMADED